MTVQRLTHTEWESVLTHLLRGLLSAWDLADAHTAEITRHLSEGFRPDLPAPREPE